MFGPYIIEYKFKQAFEKLVDGELVANTKQRQALPSLVEVQRGENDPNVGDVTFHEATSLVFTNVGDLSKLESILLRKRMGLFLFLFLFVIFYFFLFIFFLILIIFIVFYLFVYLLSALRAERYFRTHNTALTKGNFRRNANPSKL
jgi:hypothetical protein